MSTALFWLTWAGACAALAVLYAWVARSRRGTGAVIAANAVLVVLLLALALAPLELYTRYVYDGTDSFGLSRVTKRWFERHYQLNNLGYRDDVDYALAKPPGRVRVSLLGDSLTAGHGVEQVSDRFANRLRERLGPEVEVHVLAENGRDLGHHLAALQELAGRGYETDWVVLVTNLTDISDITPEWQAVLKRLYADRNLYSWWARSSWFLDQTYVRLKGRLDPDVWRYYGFVLGAYEGRVWRQQRARLELWKQRSRALGARPAGVLFPFLQPGAGQEAAEEAAYARLLEGLGEGGVPVLDLRRAFAAETARDWVVSRFDAHPNEAAHLVAAVAIGDFLEELLAARVPESLPGSS